MYRFSERLAWVAGVVLPVLETVRRWGTWWEFPPAYLDDLLIGGFFLVGAWMSAEMQPSAVGGSPQRTAALVASG